MRETAREETGEARADEARRPTRHEDSGLHDMRSLAREAMKRVTDRELVAQVEADAAILGSTATASVVMPLAHLERPAALLAGGHSRGGRAARVGRLAFLAAGLGLAGGAAFVAFGDLWSDPARSVVVSAAASPVPAAATRTPDPSPATQGPAPAAALAPAAPAEEAAAPVPAESPSRAKHPSRAAGKRDEATARAPVARTAVPAAKPEAPASLDQLLDDASATKASKVVEEPEETGGPTSLSRDAVRAGMAGIRPRIDACYDKFKVSGTVMVKLTISPDGKVSRADPDGPLTDTAACVTAAARSATFSRWHGAPLTMKVPFKVY